MDNNLSFSDDKPQSNFFFAFEGIDGSGKTTQINLLKKELQFLGKDVIVIREPGGGEISETIRKILLDTKNSLNNFTELYLFFAARSQIIQDIICPALREGKIVLADRYIWSTLAYQGFGRGIDLNFIYSLCQQSSQLAFPVHSFFLNLDYEKALSLRFPNNKDRMEQNDASFFSRVAQGYLDIAQHNRGIVSVIDAQLPINNIATTILQKVKSFI